MVTREWICSAAVIQNDASFKNEAARETKRDLKAHWMTVFPLHWDWKLFERLLPGMAAYTSNLSALEAKDL